MGYNIKGVTVAKVNYMHDCNYQGCKRSAFYKFSASTAVGKAFRNAAKSKEKRMVWKNGKQTSDFEMIDKIPYGSGYFCSFDCARKHLLVKTFEAKVKLTPLIKDFLGQGEIPITDHETIIEDSKDIFMLNNSNPGMNEDYIKVSPNGISQYPIQIDFSHRGHNEPIGFTLEGANKLISALQTIVNEEDTWRAEQAHMGRRKRLTK
jgi:hypothetical protein